MEKENNCGLVMTANPHQIKEGERERKIAIEGKMSFSFGKNGLGLTDELIQIGELVKTLSKDIDLLPRLKTVGFLVLGLA
jgi:hypothetical protein